MAKDNSSRKNKTKQTVITKKSKSPGFLPEAIILLLIISAFIYLCIQVSFIQDDAYISFRHVKNFTAGNGLVFNVGEYVEGYTNFLWVILLSIFVFIKLNIESVAQILSISFGALNLILVYFITRILTSRISSESANDKNMTTKLFNFIPSAMTTLAGAYSFWAVSAMETTMFIFFSLAGIYFYLELKDKPGWNYLLPASLLLASLTRPEGAILFGIVYLHKFVYLFINKKENSFKSFSLETLVFIIPYVLYLLFRYFYYGYFFPNTFYAKTGVSSVYIQTGLNYFYLFTKSYLLNGIIGLLPLYLIRNNKTIHEISFIYGYILIYSLYVILVGGDVLSLHRFLLPVLPLFFILWSLLLFEIGKTILNKLAAIPFVLILASLGIAFFNYFGEQDEINRIQKLEKDLVEKMKIQAKWFYDEQQKTGKKITVALSTIGAFSYFSESEVIDLLGLTDSYIAHNPVENKEISTDSTVSWKERHYNAEYIIKRRPDFISFSTGQKPSAFAERALFAMDDFFKYYYVQYIYLPDLKAGLVVYTKKSDEQAALWKTLPANPQYSARYISYYVDALNQLTKYYSTKDRQYYDGVMEAAERTLKYAPAYFADIYRVLGEAYSISREYQKAEQCFLKVIELDETNALASLGLAHLYEKIKSPLEQKYTALALKYSPYILN